MEGLFYILYNVAEMINYLLGYEVLFQMKLKNKPILIGVFILGNMVMHMIIMHNNVEIETGEVNFIYGLIIPLILISESKIKGILVYFDVVMITSIINICVSYAVSLWMGIPQSDVRKDYGKAFVINSFFMVAAIVILKKKKKNESDIEFPKFTILQYIIITICVFSTVIIIAVIQAITDGDTLSIPKLNLYGLCVTGTFIIFAIVVVWLSYSIKRNATYEKQQEIMSLYMDKQEEYIYHIIQKDEEMRRFRHDIRGHVSVLQHCINTGDISKAREYLDEISDVITNENVKKYTGISAVDAMISDMEGQMKEKNITLEWKGNIPKHRDIKVFDMCTLFVNLLNNAVEACEKLESERKITVNTYMYEGKIYISEENRYTGEICLCKDGTLMTTKPDEKNHGIGSRNIKNVVEKYDGKIEYNLEDGKFKVEILI